MRSVATTVSYQEWLGMPKVRDAAEGDRRIRITPPAKWVHARTVSEIHRALLGRLDQGRFLIATAQFGLVMRKEPLTVRVPDLALFEISTIVEQEGFVHSPPQLIAEVLAPGEDLSRRVADYASVGVPDVWVISPEARTVEVLTFENGGMHGRQAFCDSAFASPTYPQVTVDVADLWSDWRPQRVE
jgi:Uma2 family endonuclease